MRVMQVLVLLLLPVLAAGTSFEVCKGREVCLSHDEQQHMACCGHHAGVASQESQTCHCSHHHHHEQIRWLMDVGARPERLFVAMYAATRPMSSPVELLPEPQGAGVILTAPPGRKLSPTGWHLLPLIC